MTTWADIKLKTLQKMFAAKGNTIPTDSSTTDYLAAMPGVANEALQMLATAGKFIIKAKDIAHTPVDNLLSNGATIFAKSEGEFEFEADGVRSLTFAYCGEGEYTVEVGGIEVFREELPLVTGFETIKRLVPNDANERVVLKITTEYPMSVMNVGMYTAKFRSDEAIQPYSEKIRYDLKELIDDFYMLADEGIVFEGGLKNRYLTTDEYLVEGGSVLLLDRKIKGNFRVCYKAYPQQITDETDDDTVLSIDNEVAALLPLYMASQLYKDDDIGVATTYRNEFEVAFERLSDAPKGPSSEYFKAESGWV